MPIKAEIRGERALLDFVSRLPRQLSKEVTSEAAKEGFQMLAKATESKHRETGAMRRSIFNRRSGTDGRQIGFDPNIAPHAVYVLRGTRPHVIVPRNKSILKFYWERIGETVFRQSVNHPGYEGDDMILEAVNRIQRIMKSIVRDATRNVK